MLALGATSAILSPLITTVMLGSARDVITSTTVALTMAICDAESDFEHDVPTTRSTAITDDAMPCRPAHGFCVVLMLSCIPVSYTHFRAHETPEHLVCRL